MVNIQSTLRIALICIKMFYSQFYLVATAIHTQSRRSQMRVCTYRVFHDLWTLLQEVMSQVFVINKVHINMCPILDGYGVMTV